MDNSEARGNSAEKHVKNEPTEAGTEYESKEEAKDDASVGELEARLLSMELKDEVHTIDKSNFDHFDEIKEPCYMHIDIRSLPGASTKISSYIGKKLLRKFLGFRNRRVHVRWLLELQPFNFRIVETFPLSNFSMGPRNMKYVREQTGFSSDGNYECIHVDHFPREFMRELHRELTQEAINTDSDMRGYVKFTFIYNNSHRFFHMPVNATFEEVEQEVSR
mmetsp:Transcript_18847/g.36989  ORF Transcript_18847/g.36989 Transcript_18847/m.36989 type:complete len:220 (-) Transcript_18847:743-1402(-)